MKLSASEWALIKEALRNQYKRQTELLNQKPRLDDDPVMVKWQAIGNLIQRIINCGN